MHRYRAFVALGLAGLVGVAVTIGAVRYHWRPGSLGGPLPRAALVRIPLDRDQSFYTVALVNGVPIRFAIDTGAAITVLRAEDAAKAGFALRTTDFRGRLQGVTATAPVAEVTIDRLTLGEIDIRNIRADVEDGALDVSLLRQNFISKTA